MRGWSSAILAYMLCFFFQAEDGIRDGRVTGVQTCALPISHRNTRANSPFQFQSGASVAMRRWQPFDGRKCIVIICLSFLRSEERRVGKECRFRWVMEL